MKVHHIPYEQTGYFSGLILDYLKQDPALDSFYTGFPTIENFQKQAVKKAASFSSSQRSILVQALKEQYSGVQSSESTNANINRLQEESSFTITTGHQLSLLTGPLFFIFKIATVIKLCRDLKKAQPNSDFVPVYWMATEDHDFEEISNFQFKGKKYQWAHPEEGGKVGDLLLDSLQPVLDLFETVLPKNKVASQLKELIVESYRKPINLAQATRVLVNHLFGEEGLVIIDGDHSRLKKSFAPYMQKELEEQSCHTAVQNQIEQLQQQYQSSYKAQVSPRELNLFYLSPGKRQRIIKEEDGFVFDGDSEKIPLARMITLLEENPERFSPNVLMRPLYQEAILPNLGYIGGGGELAYWFQLNSYFTSQKIPFPLLVLRNSAVLLNAKTSTKIKNMELAPADFFLRRNGIIKKKTKQISGIDLDLSFLKKELEKNFAYLEGLVSETDASFDGAVRAQRQKQFKGIDHLEKRLLQAQKRKLKDQLDRLVVLYESLFPGEGLQERQLNFSDFYLETNGTLIPDLIASFEPLRFEFSWIEL